MRVKHQKSFNPLITIKKTIMSEEEMLYWSSIPVQILKNVIMSKMENLLLWERVTRENDKIGKPYLNTALAILPEFLFLFYKDLANQMGCKIDISINSCGEKEFSVKDINGKLKEWNSVKIYIESLELANRIQSRYKQKKIIESYRGHN